VGCVSNIGLGLAEVEPHGRSATNIAHGLSDGDLSALVLLGADPVRDFPEQQLWETALDSASSVIAFAGFLTPAIEEHAEVVFPAESYAEKEGTVTHPDGRLQRVRQAIGHPAEVRPAWSVLAELCNRLGAPLEAPSAPAVTAELTSAVPFYAGITLEEIGGKGVRWQEREPASAAPEAELPDTPLEAPPELPEGMRVGIGSTLWSGREAEHSPSLRFLLPRQRAELSPEDARRLGVSSGDEVVVSANGRGVRATAAVRSAMPAGSVFLIGGTEEDSGTVIADGAPRTVEVRKA
jgi:NADH-quinone oxidoreductase subunit G